MPKIWVASCLVKIILSGTYFVSSSHAKELQAYSQNLVTYVGYLYLVPKIAGSIPAEAVGFFRRKNPQHAFLGGK